MADIHSGNWSFREPGNDIPDGSVIYGGNFSQLLPDTPILAGKTLTIRGGNWTNVRRDAAWAIEGGGFGDIDFCYHLHPERALAVEVENCRHVYDTDEIWVDSVLIDTIYYRKDLKV
jgi:hypothetical protein